jgi:hypothetical protein
METTKEMLKNYIDIRDRFESVERDAKLLVHPFIDEAQHEKIMAEERKEFERLKKQFGE